MNVTQLGFADMSEKIQNRTLVAIFQNSGLGKLHIEEQNGPASFG
jgi:TRAP-type uncharacterized transport system substrate-binding protein